MARELRPAAIYLTRLRGMCNWTQDDMIVGHDESDWNSGLGGNGIFVLLFDGKRANHLFQRLQRGGREH